MIDLEMIKSELGDILDTVADKNYEGWKDYWVDRDAEVEHLFQVVMEWQSRSKELG